MELNGRVLRKLNLPLVEKSGGSLEHFVEIRDMLMREGLFLQGLEALGDTTENLTNVLQRLLI